MTNPESAALVVSLASGDALKVRRIALFDEQAISEAAVLRAQATEKLGGVSTGIGFLGSPAWVLGAGAMLSAVENALSKSAMKEGVQLLERAATKAEAVYSTAKFFDVGEIENSQFPTPPIWRAFAVAKRSVDLSEMGILKRSKYMSEMNIRSRDIQNGVATIESRWRFVHNGDDFVLLQTEAGLMSVRWSGIVSWSVLRP